MEKSSFVNGSPLTQSSKPQSKKLNSESNDFVWDCGTQISIKAISKHFNTCSEMKTKYSKLFMDIDKLVTKEATSIQDWINVQNMFTFLESHMKMMINKERKKPSHFKSDEPKSLKRKPSVDDSPDSKSPQNNYFSKINNSGKDLIEEEKIDMGRAQDPYSESQRCEKCKKYITHEDEK